MKGMARWAVLAVSVLLVAVLPGRPSQASNACQNVVIGVNNAGLVWAGEEEGSKSLDDMAAQGVRFVRIGFRRPFNRFARLVRHANELGISVVAGVPLGLKLFYLPSAEVRPGNGTFRAVRHLSQIDPGRFAAAWKEQRARLLTAQAKVFAYEIGNETNNPGFNGDMPVASEGRVMSLSACDLGAACQAIERGLEKYVQILRFVREQGGLDNELIIAGGMAHMLPTAWLRRSGGVFAPARDFIDRLYQLGANKYVDAYAIHLYPPKGLRSFGTYVDNALSDCRLADRTGKNCWVTEWGIRSATASCPPAQSWIDAQAGFVRALKRWVSKGLGAAIYFDWNQHPRLSVMRCGRLAASPAVAITSDFCAQ